MKPWRAALMLATVQVAFCSGIYLDRKASWSKALENLFQSPLLRRPLTDVTMSGLPPAQDKTLPAGAVSLEDEANWLVAWQKNLSRQSLYNNIVKEVFNSMTRIIGWALISFVLYGLLVDSAGSMAEAGAGSIIERRRSWPGEAEGETWGRAVDNAIQYS